MSDFILWASLSSSYIILFLIPLIYQLMAKISAFVVAIATFCASLFQCVPVKRDLSEVKTNSDNLKTGLNLGGLYRSICELNVTKECTLDDSCKDAEQRKTQNTGDFKWILESFDLCNLAQLVTGYAELASVKRTQLEKFIKNQQNVASWMSYHHGLPKFCRVAKTFRGNSTASSLKFCDVRKIFCSRLASKFIS